MNLEKIKEMLSDGKYLYFTSETGRGVEKEALQSARNILGCVELKIKQLGRYEGLDDEELQLFDGDSIYYIEK